MVFCQEWRSNSIGANLVNGECPCRVLLVDDDEDVLLLFKMILESGGFSVAAAPEGGAAAKCHSDLGRVDLLITDIDMPGLTGFDLADALSQKQPDLPVLFVTGGLTGEDTGSDHAQRSILQKPITARTLLASVDQMLSNHYAIV